MRYVIIIFLFAACRESRNLTPDTNQVLKLMVDYFEDDSTRNSGFGDLQGVEVDSITLLTSGKFKVYGNVALNTIDVKDQLSSTVQFIKIWKQIILEIQVSGNKWEVTRFEKVP